MVIMIKCLLYLLKKFMINCPVHMRKEKDKILEASTKVMVLTMVNFEGR